jgi:hypothetical protein
MGGRVQKGCNAMLRMRNTTVVKLLVQLVCVAPVHHNFWDLILIIDDPPCQKLPPPGKALLEAVSSSLDHLLIRLGGLLLIRQFHSSSEVSSSFPPCRVLHQRVPLCGIGFHRSNSLTN